MAAAGVVECMTIRRSLSQNARSERAALLCLPLCISSSSRSRTALVCSEDLSGYEQECASSWRPMRVADRLSLPGVVHAESVSSRREPVPPLSR